MYAYVALKTDDVTIDLGNIFKHTESKTLPNYGTVIIIIHGPLVRCHCSECRWLNREIKSTLLAAPDTINITYTLNQYHIWYFATKTI